MGQPIIRGHYSEKRDRKNRKKIDKYMQKAIEVSGQAEYYSRKSQASKPTAQGKKYKDKHFLARRIKESESLIRVFERKISGSFYPGSPIVSISDQSKAFYDKNIADQKEKLDFYYKCMKEIKPDWQPAQKTSKKKEKGSDYPLSQFLGLEL